MKRYDLWTRDGLDSASEECAPAGDWVLYEDHLIEVAPLLAALEAAEGALEKAAAAMQHPTGDQQGWKDIAENKALKVVSAALAVLRAAKEHEQGAGSTPTGGAGYLPIQGDQPSPPPSPPPAEAEAEVERLRGALRPFSERAAHHECAHHECTLTRAARAALRGEEESDAG